MPTTNLADQVTGKSNTNLDSNINSNSPTLNKRNNSEIKLNTSILNKSSSDTANADIIGLIVSNTKDVKISLNKLIEQNKQLNR